MPSPQTANMTAVMAKAVDAGYNMIIVLGVLGIEEKQLRAQYAQEIESGQIKVNATVAENLFRKATGDGREAVTAAIFWLKAARWKEVSMHEHDRVEPGRKHGSNEKPRHGGVIGIYCQ